MSEMNISMKLVATDEASDKLKAFKTELESLKTSIKGVNTDITALPKSLSDLQKSADTAGETVEKAAKKSKKAIAEEKEEVESLTFSFKEQIAAREKVAEAMAKDAEVLKSHTAQQHLYNSALRRKDEVISDATISEVKQLTGLKSKIEYITSEKNATEGLTKTDEIALEAKTRRQMAYKKVADAVKSSTEEGQRKAQERLGADIAAITKRTEAEERASERRRLLAEKEERAAERAAEKAAERRRLLAEKEESRAARNQLAGEYREARTIINMQKRYNKAIGANVPDHLLFASKPAYAPPIKIPDIPLVSYTKIDDPDKAKTDAEWAAHVAEARKARPKGADALAAAQAAYEKEKNTALSAEATAEKWKREDIEIAKDLKFQAQTLSNQEKFGTQMAAANARRRRDEEKHGQDILALKRRTLAEEMAHGEQIISIQRNTDKSSGVHFDSAKLFSAEAAAIRNSEKALAEHAKGHKSFAGVIRESLVLMREFSRGDFSRMAGSFSILAQLGGAPIVALTALVGSIGLVAKAYAEGETQGARFGNAIKLTGNFAGQTERSMVSLAEKTANAGNMTIGASKVMVLAYTKSGVMGGEVMDRLSAVTAKYAEITGTDVPKATEHLIKMFEDPAKAAVELGKQMHFSAAKILEIQDALKHAGDEEKAQMLLVDALKGSLAGLDAQAGTLSRTWQSLKNSMSEAYDGIAAWGRPEAVDNISAISRAAEKMRQTRQDKRDRGEISNEEYLKGYRAIQKGYEASRKLTADNTVKEAEDSKRNKELTDASQTAKKYAKKGSTDDIDEDIRAMQKAITLFKETHKGLLSEADAHLLKVLENGIKGAEVSRANLLKRINPTSINPTSTKAEFNVEAALSTEGYRLLDDERKRDLKSLEENYKSKLVDAKEYYDKKKEILEQSVRDEIAILTEHRAALASDLVTDKKNPDFGRPRNQRGIAADDTNILIKQRDLDSVSKDLALEQQRAVLKERMDDLKKKIENIGAIADSELAVKDAENQTAVLAGKILGTDAQGRAIENKRASAKGVIPQLQTARAEAVAGRTAAIDAGRTEEAQNYDKIIADVDKKIVKANQDMIQLSQSAKLLKDVFSKGIGDFLGNIEAGGKKAHDVFRQLFDSITQGITDIVNKRVTEQITNSLMDTLGLGAGGNSGGVGGSGGSGGVGGWIGTILSGTAGGNGAGTNVGGSIMNLLPGMMTFASGADTIPRDMIAQIHKGEMILPADTATKVRNNLAQGGKTQASNPQFNFNIPSNTDTRTQYQIAQAAFQGMQAAMGRG